MVKILKFVSYALTALSLILFFTSPIAAIIGLMVSIMIQEFRSGVIYNKYKKYKEITNMYRDLAKSKLATTMNKNWR